VVGRRDRRRPLFAPLDREERRAEDTWSAGHIDIKAADYPEEQNGKSRDEQTQDIEDRVGQLIRRRGFRASTASGAWATAATSLTPRRVGSSGTASGAPTSHLNSTARHRKPL